MARKIFCTVAVVGAITGGLFAQEPVVDVKACGELAQQNEKMAEQLVKLGGILGAAEKVKEHTDKVKEYTDKIKEYIGDAKEYTIDVVDDVVGIDNILAVNDAANEVQEAYKTGYDVYKTGKSMYDKGEGIYKMFEQKDMNIKDMQSQLKTLGDSRKDLMETLRARTMLTSAAKDQAQIAKEQVTVSTAGVKMMSNVAQEVSTTNSLLLQQMQDANAREQAVTEAREKERDIVLDYNARMKKAVGYSTEAVASEGGDDWLDK
jgi:hypothetical protein